MNKTPTAAVATCCLAACCLAGCAPEAWTNRKATGFNAFVDEVADACAPLEVGPVVVTRNFQAPNYAQGQYDAWLNQTSLLYYRRITPEKYVENIRNLSTTAGTVRAAQCVAQRAGAAGGPPPSPPPTVIR